MSGTHFFSLVAVVAGRSLPFDPFNEGPRGARQTQPNAYDRFNATRLDYRTGARTENLGWNCGYARPDGHSSNQFYESGQTLLDIVEDIERLTHDEARMELDAGHGALRLMNFGAGRLLYHQDPLSAFLRSRMGDLAALYVEPNPRRLSELRSQRRKKCGRYNGTLKADDCMGDILFENTFASADTLPALVASFRSFARIPWVIDRLKPPASANRVVQHTIHVVKIDIDSIDCEVMRSLVESHGIKPWVFTLEVNPLFPPPIKFVRRKVATDSGDQGHSSPPLELWGCSLSAQIDFLRAHDYILLFYSGYDSIFVRRDILMETAAAASALQTPAGESTVRFDELFSSPPLREYVRHLATRLAQRGDADGGQRIAELFPRIEIDEFECYRMGASQSSHAEFIRDSLFRHTPSEAVAEAHSKFSLKDYGDSIFIASGGKEGPWWRPSH